MAFIRELWEHLGDFQMLRKVKHVTRHPELYPTDLMYDVKTSMDEYRSFIGRISAGLDIQIDDRERDIRSSEMDTDADNRESS